ncbi:MAG TPA: SCO family protein [Bacteroidota bacterium]|nr:SCO family protein [Bacteroidota bacterium]
MTIAVAYARLRTFAAVLAVLFVGAAAAAETPAEVSSPERLGIVEKLGGRIPLEEEVYDEHGNLVTLRSVIQKPTILTFVYYRCPGICSPLLTELSRMVGKVDLEPGKDYQIVTISFDHREKPELALEKQENYLSAIARPVSPSAWHFFTADSAVIQRLTDAAGFYFKPNGQDYVHATALIFLSPDGKITHYMNGIQYLPFDIKLALLDASEGKTGPTIAKVLQFCFSYDPQGHRYALNVTRIGLVLTLVFAAIFTLVFIVRPGKKHREDVHGTAS